MRHTYLIIQTRRNGEEFAVTGRGGIVFAEDESHALEWLASVIRVFDPEARVQGDILFSGDNLRWQALPCRAQGEIPP